ncbi:tail length tape measure protein [Pseudomonas sp. HMSC08G10]|uniref:phage tail length tape measure family protein n=1 Tax=Pseudomonas sp. HMSC08G10 TaxID=1581141 RepID=UPI0008A281E9|nr:phage tail length tape measure family protein [Pseudomonas sp. HMSC08G10]OFS77152.1 tail length tape measure protein [Pseudomonas sp. HMSC08G10]
MAQESRLAVTIDSRGAKRNADDLTGSLQQMERAGDAAASSADGVSDSLDDQRRALSQLLGQINPTTAALGRLDDMQEKLAKFKKAGIVESDTFVEYTDRINTMRAALGETADGMNRAGMSAKAYQAALRGVPAQFTDIAVSLQAGQSPLTVFLQQGGQLKDMFGGAGPAARALGGYIVGLINPFTSAAAAAGVLALAYHQGSEESERFSNALIENGNAAGLTANQLIDMANQVAATSGTVGAAAGVLTQLAASGNPLRTMYVEITQASLAWSKQTGRDITDVVQTFNDIGKSPVEAIKKLDGELNILTASQYANIQSLQEQGRTMDAAAMAAGLYAEAISSRAGEIERNLGALESAWQSITGAAKKAWDAMLDVGRDQSIEEQIANTEKLIAQRKGGIIGFFAGDDDQTLRGLETRLKQLQKALASNAAQAAQDASNKALQDAGKKGVDLINSTYKSSLTQTQKLQKQLTDLEKARKDAIAAGGFTAAEEEKYAKSRKSIEQEIAEIKTREAKKNAPKGANKGVSEAETTFARLYGQYDPAAQAARTLTKEQTQLQLALDRGKISQEEYGKALAQASINYASAIKGAQGLTQAEQYRAQLERQLANQRNEYSIAAAGVGMGDQQTQRLQQRVQLEQQTNDRILQLRTELANATTEKQRQDLQAQIDLTNEFLPRQLEALQNGWAQMDQAMLNPINGWTAAVQNFGVQATNVAGQTQSIFSTAFGSVTQGITDQIMNLNLSFQSLGDLGKNVLREIVAGFVKMGVQMGLNAALAATLGTATAGTSIALAGTTAAAWAPAAALASLASFGGNSVPAAAALTSTTALATTLAAVPGFATGGYFTGSGTGTSDSNLAKISNGEFIVNAAATRKNRALLEAINSGERVSTSGSAGVGTGGSPMPQPIVQIYQDPSRAGTSQVTREGNQDFIKVWVASIMGDGEADQAMRAKYGLQGVGS